MCCPAPGANCSQGRDFVLRATHGPTAGDRPGSDGIGDLLSELTIPVEPVVRLGDGRDCRSHLVVQVAREGDKPIHRVLEASGDQLVHHDRNRLLAFHDSLLFSGVWCSTKTQYHNFCIYKNKNIF